MFDMELGKFKVFSMLGLRVSNGREKKIAHNKIFILQKYGLDLGYSFMPWFDYLYCPELQEDLMYYQSHFAYGSARLDDLEVTDSVIDCTYEVNSAPMR